MNNEVVIMLKNFRSPTTLIVLLAGLAGLSLVLYAWRLPPFASSVETTENAYVRGYVTTISPQLSGYVAEVPVRDYEEVRAGQLLVRIDDRIYVQKLAQAKATLATQRSALANSFEQELSAKAGIAASEASSTGPKRLWQRREPPGTAFVRSPTKVSRRGATPTRPGRPSSRRTRASSRRSPISRFRASRLRRRSAPAPASRVR